MKKMELIYLSQADVLAAGISLKQYIGIIEGVFKEHGDGQYEMPPKGAVHPLSDAFLHSMPGWLKRKGLVGIKWVSGFFSNEKKYGIPSAAGLIILNDVRTGMPVAILDGGYINIVRTAAASGVAAKYLAKKKSEIIGVVGAGVQARYQILALKEVLPDVKLVKVFDNDKNNLDRYIRAMSEAVNFKIEPAESAQAVISSADVNVIATGWLDERIFKESWIMPGGLILPIHSRGWEPEALHKVDKFVVDDFKQLSFHVGQPGGYYYPLPDSYSELGEIVTGRKAGRENDHERIMDMNYGMALHDLAIGGEILPLAKEKGLGTTLTLAEEKVPFT